MRSLLELKTSTSQSLSDRYDFNAERHFRWGSINKFIFLANAYTSSTIHFDVFSRAVKPRLCFPLSILFGIWPGMAYMFMDLFIKLYTRKLDYNANMNPLLRGVSVGIMLQTAVWSLIHARDLADSIRYLISSFHSVPMWSRCQNQQQLNHTCYSSEDVIRKCRNRVLTDLHVTSVHVYYNKSFIHLDENNMSTRTFVTALVWLGNFFITTITSSNRLKFFKITFFLGLYSTVVIIVVQLFESKFVKTAFYEIMTIRHDSGVHLKFTSDIYGVGLVGVYDFETMSPYTMVDNAVVIFTLVLIITSLARSLIVQMMVFHLGLCVDNLSSFSPHYLYFAVLPLSAEFMLANKIYMLYIYLNLTAGTTACLTMFTATVSRQIHSEFQSIKIIYIVGLFCFIGFAVSLYINTIASNKVTIVMQSLNMSSISLGSLRMAIVMWIYGVKRFCDDVHFWLGFKPTKCWRVLWVTLPVFLFFQFVGSYFLFISEYAKEYIWTNVWLGFTFAVMLAFHIKTIVKYISNNNLVGIFKSSPEYGPPDKEDRKRRRRFDEITQNRICHHECLVFQENFTCYHVPVSPRSRTRKRSADSLRNIYNPAHASHSSTHDMYSL